MSIDDIRIDTMTRGVKHEWDVRITHLRTGRVYVGRGIGAAALKRTTDVLTVQALQDENVPHRETCRVCGGYGFVAQKRFLEDGYGEAEPCPACEQNVPDSETRPASPSAPHAHTD
jgi:hypothetical protein